MGASMTAIDTFETVRQSIQQAEPALSENMVTAFAMLAMADFRKHLQPVETAQPHGKLVTYT
jgi:hypothetical protein